MHAAGFRLDAMSRRAIFRGDEHGAVCGGRNSWRNSGIKRWEFSSRMMHRASRRVSMRQPKRPRHSARFVANFGSGRLVCSWCVPSLSPARRWIVELCDRRNKIDYVAYTIAAIHYNLRVERERPRDRVRQLDGELIVSGRVRRQH